MVKPKINMIGSRFHRLVVEAYAPDYIAPDGKHFTNCLCRCDCGDSDGQRWLSGCFWNDNIISKHGRIYIKS